MHYLGAALVILFSFSAVHTQKCCPNGWIGYGKSCYLFSQYYQFSMPEASFLCEKLGGKLAEIGSKSELEWIRLKLLKVGRLKKGTFWIGAYRLVPGKFTWITSGEDVEDGFWDKNEPNGGSEQCVFMGKVHRNRYLCDGACKSKNGYICEK